MHEPNPDRQRERAGELADDEAPRAGTGQRQRDADHALCHTLPEPRAEQAAEPQGPTQQVLVGLSERGEREVEGEDTEERHDLLTRPYVRQQRGGQPREPEQDGRSQDSDPERGRGDRLILAIG